jgi:AcrR family transcriptional regulator
MTPAAAKRRRAPERRRKPTERDQATRRRIIRAAAEIYRECGYERAGMIDIARRLGMTAPALFGTFVEKTSCLHLELLIAGLAASVRNLVRAAEPSKARGSWPYALTAAAAGCRRHTSGYSPWATCATAERQRQRITSLEREFYGMCRELIAAVQGRRKADSVVAPVAFAMIGMVEHLISWFRLSGAMSVQQVATLYADLAVAMAVTVPHSARMSRKVSVRGAGAG